MNKVLQSLDAAIVQPDNKTNKYKVRAPFIPSLLCSKVTDNKTNILVKDCYSLNNYRWLQ